MESLKSVANLGRRRERCGSGNPSMRSNLAFTDTSSLESIFLQLGVSPVGHNKPESLSRSKANRSSEPRILKVARKSFDTLDVGVTRQHERHLKINPELLAQQITLIELRFFQAIQPEEFLSLKWNSKEKLKYAPNIVASTRWFNQIIFWVQKDVLHEENLSRRAEVLSHFVRIAKKLVEMNNYSSAMAIVCGLLVQSVYRLSATWAALSSRDRSSFRKLADLFSQDQNFINLRTAIDTARLPCIPYLGIYLSDLTYIDVAAATANQHENGGSWGSHGRLNRMNNLLRIIANFQQSNYPFVRNEKIALYLESQRYIEELQRFIEDNNYKLSLRLEPPSNEASSSIPNDSAYPFPVKTNWFTSTVLKPVPVSTFHPESATLERRSALVPSHTRTSPTERTTPHHIRETHSTQSSPAHSISHQHRCMVDRVLPPPLIPPPPPSESSKSGRDRYAATGFVYHSFGHSSGRVSAETSGRHRRLGSWTAMGCSMDTATRAARCSTVGPFLNELPSHHNPTMIHSSWSTSSESTGRGLLNMDHTVPIQEPLGPLLDRTDLTTGTIPGPLSPVSPATSSTQNGPGSSSSGQSSTRSNYPKALTVILPNHPRVNMGSSVPVSPAGGDSTSALIQQPNSPNAALESDPFRLMHRAHSPPNPTRPNSNSCATPVEPPVATRDRSRHSASQPRSVARKTFSDKRVRNSPSRGHSDGGKQRSRTSHSSTVHSQSGTSRRVTPTRRCDSTLKDNVLGLSNSFSHDPQVTFVQPESPSTVPSHPVHHTGINQPPSIRLSPSSGACSSTSQLHSTISQNSVFFSPLGNTDQSHLAEAALAAVQGTIADELACLSGTESQRFSFRDVAPHQSSFISPTKAVCLDVQFANGLRVLREGVVQYQRCSEAAFRQAKLVQPTPTGPNLKNKTDTWFGSCDALDAFRTQTTRPTKWNASFTESTNTDLGTGCEPGLSSPNLLTPSPSHSLSRASLTSFVLDLPSLSSASSVSSSSAFSGESFCSSPFSPAVPSYGIVPHHKSTNSTCGASLPPNHPTVSRKRGIIHWFHRLVFNTRSDLRVKLRWGVLIQSDTECSPAFLVLFKLHPSTKHGHLCPYRSGGTASPGGLLTSPTVATIAHNPKHVQQSKMVGTRSDVDARARTVYTPEMFSTGNCRVLAIDTAVLDSQPTRTPSVIISDLIGAKRKIYRFSPVLTVGATSSSASRSCDVLNTVLHQNPPLHTQIVCNPTHVTGPSARATTTFPWPQTAFRFPWTNLRRTEGTLRSLRRLWPATWMAAQRYRRAGVRKAAPQNSTPQITPTGQSDNQTTTEAPLTWLSLLMLFPR